MATYSQQYGGYIADVPKLWFRRCDGRVFHFDELTRASVTPQVNQTEINAGWSMFPVAYLPGQSTFELSATSAKFEADLFAMTNAVKFEDNPEYTAFVRKPVAEQVIEQTITIKAGETTGSVSISIDNGYGLFIAAFPVGHIAERALVKLSSTGSCYSDDPSQASSDHLVLRIQGVAGFSGLRNIGEYTNDFYQFNTSIVASINPVDQDVSYKIVCVVPGKVDDAILRQATFNAAITGETLSVYAMCAETLAATEAKIDNKSSAIGEAILAYPVYSNGDDCTESSIIGTVYLKVYRARITQQPGFDTSYKSAASFQFTLSAMDAKRADEAVYSIAYVRK